MTSTVDCVANHGSGELFCFGFEMVLPRRRRSVRRRFAHLCASYRRGLQINHRNEVVMMVYRHCLVLLACIALATSLALN